MLNQFVGMFRVCSVSEACETFEKALSEIKTWFEQRNLQWLKTFGHMEIKKLYAGRGEFKKSGTAVQEMLYIQIFPAPRLTEDQLGEFEKLCETLFSETSE